jgi:hypothetical protein
MIVGIGRMRTAVNTMSALTTMVAVIRSVLILLAAHSVTAGQDSGWQGTPPAKVCMLRLGHYKYKSSSFTDIDECQAIVGACSQICENTAGSFMCNCAVGFKPGLKNPNQCKVAEGKVGIIFSHQTDLRLLDISQQETSVIVEDTRSATNLVILSISFPSSRFIIFRIIIIGQSECIGQIQRTKGSFKQKLAKRTLM